MYLMDPMEVYTEETFKTKNLVIKYRKCSKLIAHHYQNHKIPCQFAAEQNIVKFSVPSDLHYVRRTVKFIRSMLVHQGQEPRCILDDVSHALGNSNVLWK